MSQHPEKLQLLIDTANELAPVRVAVACAAQPVVLETLRDATLLGLVAPQLVGEPDTILSMGRALDWQIEPDWIVPAMTDTEAASLAVAMLCRGKADVLMKGNLHTDVLMRAVLHPEGGLRSAGRRCSHIFLLDIPGHDRLIGISDAAINIAPDLVAKGQICQNAIDLFHTLGAAAPRVAVLSAVETVTATIPSTLDAAALTLMAPRVTAALAEAAE